MEIFSSILRKLWNVWELPSMVFLSLLLQVVLIPMGYKRKRSSNVWVRWLLWICYLSADWVATVSLGILSNDDGDDCDGTHGDSQELPRYVIRALWAPFLLLHLGGPDTITAYSMQDNDLWLRHLLGLLVQAGLTFYVFIRALQPTSLNFVAIPVFVAGIIKYGERTWVLRCASTQQLRDQLLSVPHVDPNSKSWQGHRFPKRIGFLSEVIGRDSVVKLRMHLNDVDMLGVAHYFFQRNKRLFTDLVLSSYDLEQSLKYFEKFDSESAFKMIELELGFMYDFFYTKASIIHSRWGIVLRLTTLSSIVVAIATFYTSKTHRYPVADECLTFFLLFGALGLEICSILLLLCSDWRVIWLKRSGNNLGFEIIRPFGWPMGKRRWSNSVAQCNLITRCLEDKQHGGYGKLLRPSSYITNTTMPASVSISDELKERIFKQLNERLGDGENSMKLRGWILRKRSRNDLLGWSSELDLDQSILLWHIATDLCHYSDHESAASTSNSSLLEDSKSVSNFLAYILANRHSLFPNGMGQIRFRATVDDANEFLRVRNSIETVGNACERMWELDSSILCKNVKEDRSNSMFYHGCHLAHELRGLEGSERWEIISHMWVEMLVNTSCQCRWYEHAEQLGHGGDLLTHLWLLLHHLGYIKQAYTLSTTQQETDLNPIY